MSYLYDLADDFISLLFPRLCCGCGTFLMRNEYLICTECYVTIPRSDFHLVRDNPVEKLFWGRCRIEKGAAFSFYTRGSRMRRMIHKLKYNGLKEAGHELGKIYASSLKCSEFLLDIDLIIPVPLHPSKLRKRGFNQSEIIAKGMSEASGIPYETDILEREQMSETQTKRSRYERWLNVEGIFRVSDGSLVDGKHILLIDDVITTGSTIEACVSALLAAGDVRVSVAALAVAVE